MKYIGKYLSEEILLTHECRCSRQIDNIHVTDKHHFVHKVHV